MSAWAGSVDATCRHSRRRDDRDPLVDDRAQAGHRTGTRELAGRGAVPARDAATEIIVTEPIPELAASVRKPIAIARAQRQPSGTTGCG